MLVVIMREFRFLAHLFGLLGLLQIHAAAQAPFVDKGLMSLLLEPPFHGHFVTAEVKPGAYLAVITRDDGVTYQFHSYGDKVGLGAFLSRVQIGRRVAFPHCFFDLLGLEQVVESVRTMPGRSFAETRDDPPFRAQVLDQAIGRLSYSIVLREAGGRVHHVHGMLDEGINKHTARLLKKGGWFEFPAIIQDAGLTDQARAEKRKPSNHLHEVLERYIGQWKGSTKAVPYVTLRMCCQWEAEGDGIWREITYEHGPDVTPPAADIARVAYSAASGCYLAWNPAKEALNFRIYWYEPTKTFTTYLAPDEEGVERYNTATFIDDDHIEWKTFSKLADGRVLEMNSGSYERVSHDPEPEVADAEPRAIDVLAGQIHAFAPEMAENTFFNPKPAPNRPALPIFDKPSDSPVMEVVDATLAGLAAHPPFRARLVSKTIQPHNITLVLQHTGGHFQTIEDQGYKLAEKPEALALAGLKEGEVHEFPRCLSSKPSNTALSPAMSRLQPFIGSWSKTIRCRDGGEEAMPCVIRYFFSADGSAIWCETDMSGRQRLERIVIGEKEGIYLIAPEHASPGFQAMQGRWDEANRVLTLVRSFVNAPPGAVREESTFHLDSADQITWRCRLIAADESLIRESSGTLSRLKP